MNHTKNYGLPQWELNDLIRMEDFNTMNNSIEAGLDSNAAAAASAVNIANFAKSTATAAQQAAGNAYSPDNKPYVVGSFIGNGGTKEINLGFRPSLVLICSDQMASNSVAAGSRIAMSAGGVNTQRIAITKTGFRVTYTSSVPFPTINYANGTFDYIAFR